MGLIKRIKEAYNDKIIKLTAIVVDLCLFRMVDFLVFKKIVGPGDWDEYLKNLRDNYWLDKEIGKIKEELSKQKNPQKRP